MQLAVLYRTSLLLSKVLGPWPTAALQRGTLIAVINFFDDTHLEEHYQRPYHNFCLRLCAKDRERFVCDFPCSCLQLFFIYVSFSFTFPFLPFFSFSF